MPETLPTLYRYEHERRLTTHRGPATGACPGSTYEGVDAMGRGRQKAKQTKVARRLKYFSPETDYDALQRELANGNGLAAQSYPADDSEDDEADDDETADDETDDTDDEYADWNSRGRR